MRAFIFLCFGITAALKVSTRRCGKIEIYSLHDGNTCDSQNSLKSTDQFLYDDICATLGDECITATHATEKWGIQLQPTGKSNDAVLLFHDRGSQSGRFDKLLNESPVCARPKYRLTLTETQQITLNTQCIETNALEVNAATEGADSWSPMSSTKYGVRLTEGASLIVTRARYNQGTSPSPGPSSATGDPHMQNIYGDKFDISKQGWANLLTVPKTHGDNLTVQVLFERKISWCCIGIYVTQVKLSGNWLPKPVTMKSERTTDSKEPSLLIDGSERWFSNLADTGLNIKLLNYSDAARGYLIKTHKVEMEMMAITETPGFCDRDIPEKMQKTYNFLNVYLRGFGQIASQTNMDMGGILGSDSYSDWVGYMNCDASDTEETTKLGKVMSSSVTMSGANHAYASSAKVT